jgi:hypothetical protein
LVFQAVLRLAAGPVDAALRTLRAGEVAAREREHLLALFVIYSRRAQSRAPGMTLADEAFALTGLTSRGGLSNWVFFCFPQESILVDVGVTPALKAGPWGRTASGS